MLVWQRWSDGSFHHSLILGAKGEMDRWIIGSLPKSCDRDWSGSDGAMVHGKPFWDRGGREGGIIRALRRIIGALQRSWDWGWGGSEGAKDLRTIVLFFNFCENSAWIIGSLDHWSKLEVPPHNKPLLIIYVIYIHNICSCEGFFVLSLDCISSQSHDDIQNIYSKYVHNIVKKI